MIVLAVAAAIIIDEVVVGAAGEAELRGGAVEASPRTIRTLFCCINRQIVLAVAAAVIIDEVVAGQTVGVAK